MRSLPFGERRALVWPVLTDRSARNCQTRLRPNYCGGHRNAVHEYRSAVFVGRWPSVDRHFRGSLGRSELERSPGRDRAGVPLGICQFTVSQSAVPRRLIYPKRGPWRKPPHYVAATGSSTYASSP